MLKMYIPENKVSYHVFLLLLLVHEVYIENQEPRIEESDQISYEGRFMGGVWGRANSEHARVEEGDGLVLVLPTPRARIKTDRADRHYGDIDRDSSKGY